MSLREHVSLREHACVSSRGAQSTELVWILDFKQILLLLLLLLLSHVRLGHTGTLAYSSFRWKGIIYYRFIVRFPIVLDFPFITLPFQGC